MSQSSNATITLTPHSPSIDNATQTQNDWGRLVPKKPYISGVDLRDESYIIGRQESCKIWLNGTTLEPRLVKRLSKEHCLVSRDSTGMPYIKDLSKNGTYLNAKLVGKGNQCLLCNGDVIAIGWRTNDMYQFRLDESFNESQMIERKYRITRLLGKGAFGQVYLVYNKRNCVRYAVKKIEVMEKFIKSILTEIEILTSLSHPCVIHMHEVLYDVGHVFIVLEYMGGGVLEERVLRQGRLPEDISRLYMYQMVLAVQYLHNQGITHRDLKPENVLLANTSLITLVKLTDFGLSKIVNENYMMQTLCGTPMYVAPEVHNKLPYTPQVDVWSLGCILYFMLFGCPPFALDKDETTLAPVFARIVKAQYIIPTDSGDDEVGDDSISLIGEMLTVDPKQRIDVKQMFLHKFLDLSETTLLIIRGLMATHSSD